MAKRKAEISKEHGNVAFKAGDYAIAIGHYTSAILDDREDPTFPLNRAAAYLKLGKHKDAENDCTRVLVLNPNNAKAFFRRAQARIGLGLLQEAREDLTKAAKIEPSNESVKQELAKIDDIQKGQKGKITARQSVSSTQRRRVPIKIIGPPGETEPAGEPSMLHTPLAATPKPQAPAPKKDITLEPISSRALSERPTVSSKPKPSSPPPSKPNPSSPPNEASSNSFQQAKQARDNLKPSRVGGGIFRASGQNTIFNTDVIPDTKGSATSSKLIPSNSAPPTPVRIDPLSASPNIAGGVGGLPSKLPTTLFDFVKAWEGIKDDNIRFLLVSSIPVERYQSMFQTSLEPSLLMSVVETLLRVLEREPQNRRLRDTVLSCLEAFADVPRFNTLLLFLSKQEKETAKRLWQMVGIENAKGPWKNIL